MKLTIYSHSALKYENYLHYCNDKTFYLLCDDYDDEALALNIARQILILRLRKRVPFLVFRHTIENIIYITKTIICTIFSCRILNFIIFL